MSALPDISIPLLEGFYDRLAETLDDVGKEKSELLLIKLALLLANQARDHAVLNDLIGLAAQDL